MASSIKLTTKEIEKLSSEERDRIIKTLENEIEEIEKEKITYRRILQLYHEIMRLVKSPRFLEIHHDDIKVKAEEMAKLSAEVKQKDILAMSHDLLILLRMWEEGEAETSYIIANKKSKRLQLGI